LALFFFAARMLLLLCYHCRRCFLVQSRPFLHFRISIKEEDASANEINNTSDREYHLPDVRHFESHQKRSKRWTDDVGYRRCEHRQRRQCA
ncbi:hypothetical protein PMAYCL1PPCAC_15264, partial [Pristionchus mayeri]